jgi:UDP-glucose 4-epimerase
MKVLVTGGLGFIGSHTAARLVKEGHEVHVLDNVHTGSEANVSAISGRIKITRGDAGSLGTLAVRFDAVFHAGIYSSSPMYREEPQLTAKALSDWLAILEYCRKSDSGLAFASSSSLYNGNRPPHSEGMVIFVTDFYTEARYEMERLAELYSSLYSLPSVGLRYFSVYGPHEQSKGKYANLLSQFLWSMRAGQQPVIYGDGTQSRDFIHVDDVVEANLLALSHKGRGIFNVGTGKSTTLNEAVALLNRELGTAIRPKYEKNPIANYVSQTLADTSLAAGKLRFRASIPLEAGVRRLVREG